MFSPPEGTARPLFPMFSRVEYVDPGYLVFAREGELLAQRFDPRSGVVSGEPFSIADSVGYSLSIGQADFATSRSGALAFQTPFNFRRRMVWFDRAGRLVETLMPTGDIGGVAIDPDGRRVLFCRTEPKTGTEHLWILDLERKVETRVTSSSADDSGGIWLPDGKSIVYTAERGGLSQLRRRELDTGQEQALLPAEEELSALALVPGGAQLAYGHRSDRGDLDVRLVSLSGDQKSSPLLQTAFNETAVSFSPDGRYIVFWSDESGGGDFYVAPVAAVGDKTRISSYYGGPNFRVWSRDGSEIFWTLGEHQMSVPVRTAPSLWLGQPTPLFTLKEGTVLTGFDASPDGKRFLTVFEEPAGTEAAWANNRPLHVVLNWTAEAPAQGGPAH
jgi:dipeptidyl aminopeptidase/acylaminoacyl peptidase